MENAGKTAIVTGGSQGTGAGLVRAFLARGYNVVASSRKITRASPFEANDRLALVDGDIAEPATARAIVGAALERFGSVDALVNNAGIRVNAVAPGVVDTPMHTGAEKEALGKLQPMGRVVAVQDIVDAVLYLTEAGQVTGQVLHVDGGAHAGKW